MRQFTIAERLITSVMLRFAAMLAMPYLAALLSPFIGELNAIYGWIALTLLAIVAIGGAGSDDCAQRRTSAGRGCRYA
jgi:hypothetical protein